MTYNEEEVQLILQSIQLEEQENQINLLKMNVRGSECPSVKQELLLKAQEEARVAESEVKALQIQINQLKNLLMKKQEESSINQTLVSENESLKLQVNLLEAEKKQRNELQPKFSRLDEIYRQIEEENALQKQQIKKLMELVQGINKEKEEFNQSLIESHQHTNQLERVIHFLRERSAEAKLELDSLKEEFQNSQETIRRLNEELEESRTKDPKIEHQMIENRLSEALQREQESLSKIEQMRLAHRQDIENLNHQLNASLRKEKENLIQYNEMQVKYEKAQTVIHQKEQLQEEYIARNSQLAQDKQKFENALNEQKALHEDLEMRLKVAQQHLAKKVREVTVMSETIDEQKNLITELQNSLNHAQGKVVELQNSLENQGQQEKRLQEQFLEMTKSSDAQMRKWEEKYFAIYEKWQEVELRNKELRILEEKHHQMQAILTNLGSVINSPVSLSTALQPDTKKEVRLSLPNLVDHRKVTSKEEISSLRSQDPSMRQGSLFDVSVMSRPRNTLFD